MDVIVNATQPCICNCNNCYLKFNEFGQLSSKLNINALMKAFMTYIGQLPIGESEPTFHYYYMEASIKGSKYLVDFNKLVVDMYRYTKQMNYESNISMKYLPNSSIDNSILSIVTEEYPIDNLEISIGTHDDFLVTHPLPRIALNAKNLILNVTITNHSLGCYEGVEFYDSGLPDRLGEIFTNIDKTTKAFSTLFGKPIGLRIGLEKPYYMNKELRTFLGSMIWTFQTKLNDPKYFNQMFNVVCATNDIFLTDACAEVNALTPDFDTFLISGCPYQLDVHSCEDCHFLHGGETDRNKYIRLQSF